MANEGSGSKQIPEAVIKRLPVYHRYLAELGKLEVERISSPELAAKMGITASQLRQDLSWFGSFGQQGYGYRVKELLQEFKRILGLNQELNLVLVGAGNLGRAIASYTNFRERGFRIRAIFDTKESLIGEEIGTVKIRPLSELQNYLEKQKIEIGVITTPASAAQEIADLLVSGGVKGIWNFAPLKLRVPEGVVVEHVHISESLLILSFKLRQKNNG
ncbi:MAG: redox-sensing transcriptional repressor Rex [Bacillota bacterium]